MRRPKLRATLAASVKSPATLKASMLRGAAPLPLGVEVAVEPAPSRPV